MKFLYPFIVLILIMCNCNDKQSNFIKKIRKVDCTVDLGPQTINFDSKVESKINKSILYTYNQKNQITTIDTSFFNSTYDSIRNRTNFNLYIGKEVQNKKYRVNFYNSEKLIYDFTFAELKFRKEQTYNGYFCFPHNLRINSNKVYFDAGTIHIDTGLCIVAPSNVSK
jgi:hypothetical protein